ncbi:MAG: molybdopterin molybdotransferase MoeA [Phycisphaerales bacterium]|nr:molybdopterin molybdotransferase MoeA [Phycisphaerales bacterium]
MITLDELLQIASDLAGAPQGAESCDLKMAADRVLAQALRADRDLPPFDRAAMDGFALRHDEAGHAMPCIGQIDAGADETPEIPPGACVGIATGARVPGGLDTIVQHEWTSRSGNLITLDRVPHRGANIHPRGADARKGDVLAEAGSSVDAVTTGLAGACGHTQLQVVTRPRMALLTSGDEVVPIDQSPQPHQIRNSNAPMLQRLARRLGFEVAAADHLPDEADAVLTPIADQIAQVDVIVTTGGISAGVRDVLPQAFDDLGVIWTCIGALVQPGKPTRLGRVGSTAVVCLPGNPISALVMGTILLGRLSAALSNSPAPSWQPMPLGCNATPNPRRTLIRPCSFIDGAIHIPQWHGSGDLAHAAGTHGLVRLPMQDAPLAIGTHLPVLPWP